MVSMLASSLQAEIRSQLPLLGHGYDQETEQVLSKVLTHKNTPPIVYAGRQESDIQFKHDLSLEDLLAELNVKTSAGISLGIFTINGGVDFVSTVAKSDLTSNVVYIFDVHGKSALLNGVTFVDLAVALIKSRHAENMQKYFGSQFISQVDLGGKLLVAVSMNFANKSAKSAFHANFNMDILGFLKANAEGGVRNDELSASASINVTAKQIGGDPTRLSEIFRDSKSGAVPIVQCSLKDLKPCHEMVKAIIHYGNSFGEQLKNLEYNPNSVNGAAILGSGKSDYASHGLFEVEKTATVAELNEIKLRREGLIKTYLQYSMDRKSIEKLLGLEPSVSERVRLETLKKQIEDSISDMLATIDTCFQDPGFCLEREKELKLTSYSRSELGFDWTFYNYCEFVKDSLPVLDTVDRIRKVFPDGEHLSCEEIQTQLEKKKYLDLSHKPGLKKISDLKPLSGLKGLKKIVLDGNEIHTLAPLESNKDLDTLISRHNAFTQMPELCAFNKLRHLDLEFNPNMNIEGYYDLDCVDKVPHLEFLNVRGAHFESKRSVKAFVKAFEKNTQLKRYLTLFTSNEDVCEGHIRDQETKGLLDKEDAAFCRKKNSVFLIDSERIGTPCSDKIQPLQDN
jgi:hypothetical protein